MTEAKKSPSIMKYYDTEKFFIGLSTSENGWLNGPSYELDRNVIRLQNFKDHQEHGWQHVITYEGESIRSFYCEEGAEIATIAHGHPKDKMAAFFESCERDMGMSRVYGYSCEREHSFKSNFKLLKDRSPKHMAKILSQASELLEAAASGTDRPAL